MLQWLSPALCAVAWRGAFCGSCCGTHVAVVVVLCAAVAVVLVLQPLWCLCFCCVRVPASIAGQPRTSESANAAQGRCTPSAPASSNLAGVVFSMARLGRRPLPSMPPCPCQERRQSSSGLTPPLASPRWAGSGASATPSGHRSGGCSSRWSCQAGCTALGGIRC